MKSIRNVRERATRFVTERDWTKFHIPVNLVLALSGECGEVCEIFQWKGPNEGNVAALSSKDIENAGEEIADVFIYSTRLSDVCKINLASCISIYMNCNGSQLEFSEYSSNNFQEYSINSTTDLNFSQVVEYVKSRNMSTSRNYAISIQKCSGDICNIFMNKDELLSYPNIDKWNVKDTIQLGYYLAAISLFLVSLAVVLNLDIGECISSKFAKNEKKYPADLVQGSSAKYTEYTDIVARRNDIIGYLKNKKISLLAYTLSLSVVVSLSILILKINM